MRLNDAERNASTMPPSNEIVRLNSIFVTELYLPSHIEPLYRCLDALGWLDGDRLHWDQNDLRRWIASQRSPVAGHSWYSIGAFYRSGEGGLERQTSARIAELDLPASIHSVQLQLCQITPSLSAITFEFELSEEAALSLNELLATDYQSQSIELSERGSTWSTPDQQRADAVSLRKEELSLQCTQVVAELLPGFFAEQAAADAFPTAEYFTVEISSVVDLAVAEQPNFLDALGFERFFDFFGDELSVVLLSWLRSVSDVRRNLLIVGQAPDMARDLHWPTQPPGTRVPPTPRLFGENFLFGLIALRELLVDVTHEIGSLRDSLSPTTRSLLPSTGRLRSVETTLTSLASDLQPLLSEITSSRIATSRVPHFTGVSTRFNREPLKEAALEEIGYGAVQLEKALGHVMSSARTLSSLAGIEASERVTATNLRLQWLTLTVTLFSVVIATVALVLAWMQLKASPP